MPLFCATDFPPCVVVTMRVGKGEGGVRVKVEKKNMWALLLCVQKYNLFWKRRRGAVLCSTPVSEGAALHPRMTPVFRLLLQSIICFSSSFFLPIFTRLFGFFVFFLFFLVFSFPKSQRVCFCFDFCFDFFFFLLSSEGEKRKKIHKNRREIKRDLDRVRLH